MWVWFLLATVGLSGWVVWRRHSHCQHQFGRPTSGAVRCLRCTRQFPIETTTLGEWRIGKVPLAPEPPAHHPARPV